MANLSLVKFLLISDIHERTNKLTSFFNNQYDVNIDLSGLHGANLHDINPLLIIKRLYEFLISCADIKRYSLNLSHNSISKNQIALNDLINFISRCNNIHTLDISFNQIDDDNVIDLSKAFSVNKSLKYINLSFNNLENTGLKHLLDHQDIVNRIKINTASNKPQNNITYTSSLFHINKLHQLASSQRQLEEHNSGQNHKESSISRASSSQSIRHSHGPSDELLNVNNFDPRNILPNSELPHKSAAIKVTERSQIAPCLPRESPLRFTNNSSNSNGDAPESSNSVPMRSGSKDGHSEAVKDLDELLAMLGSQSDSSRRRSSIQSIRKPDAASGGLRENKKSSRAEQAECDNLPFVAPQDIPTKGLSDVDSRNPSSISKDPEIPRLLTPTQVSEQYQQPSIVRAEQSSMGSRQPSRISIKSRPSIFEILPVLSEARVSSDAHRSVQLNNSPPTTSADINEEVFLRRDHRHSRISIANRESVVSLRTSNKR